LFFFKKIKKKKNSSSHHPLSHEPIHPSTASVPKTIDHISLSKPYHPKRNPNKQREREGKQNKEQYKANVFFKLTEGKQKEKKKKKIKSQIEG